MVVKDKKKAGVYPANNILEVIMAEAKTPLIFQKIPAMMGDVEAVLKNRENETQHYKFRGIDDALNALNPVFVKHKVFAVPEIIGDIEREQRTNQKGNALFSSIIKMKVTFYAEDGSSVAATMGGEGFDSGDKSLPKAMACAFKYVLYDVFCIPTEEKKDAENEDPEPIPVDILGKAKESLKGFIEKVITEERITTDQIDKILTDLELKKGVNGVEKKETLDAIHKNICDYIKLHPKQEAQK
jgi:hypothetical protein